MRNAALKSVLGVVACLVAAGCGSRTQDGGTLNPFRDLPPIELNGQPQDMAYDIAPLGALDKGDVVRLKVAGPAVRAVLILTGDERFEEAGVLAGGGPPNATFSYRVQVSGSYFVHVQLDAAADPGDRRVTIAASRGDSDFHPPTRQYVRVVFEDDFLTGPGLFDPESGDSQELQFLADVSPTVRDGIVEHLRTVFDATPIAILGPSDPEPEEPVSRLTYRADRVLAEDQDAVDAALPPPDPTRPECQVRVVFGEVLPRGTRQDPGNAVRDDEAVVYVGSFQGRGETCRTSAINSLNNVVLTLAQTGAHEIGHLVGLFHVGQIDIMNRSATLAFLRELDFARGQIEIDAPSGTLVLTTVVQDPEFYFVAAFDVPTEEDDPQMLPAEVPFAGGPVAVEEAGPGQLGAASVGARRRVDARGEDVVDR